VLVSTVTSGAYKFVKLLHILTAIVGFGAVFLNGIYASRAKKGLGTPGGAAVAEANSWVTWKVAEYVIYAVFVLGLALVGMSGKIWKFSQGWIGASMGLYIVGLALVHAVLRPADKRMLAIQAQLVDGGSGADAQALAAEYDNLYRRAAVVGGVLNVLLVVIVVLMVFKPGGGAAATSGI